MHGCARQRSTLSPRPLRRLVRRLFRLAGIDLRRCFCMRCIAVRSGLFRRTRAWAGRRAYADVYLLGIRVRHCFAFEMPKTASPMSARVFGTAGRSATDQGSRSLPVARVLGAHL